MFNNVFKGVVASSVNRGGFCVEYQNVLNYAQQQGYSLPSVPQQIYQNQLMEYITGSNLYTLLDVFYVFINNGSAEFSLINWINTGSFYGSPAGATPPTWNSASGWTGNGLSGFIDTGYRPTGLSPQKFQQTNSSVFIYSTPNLPITASLIGYGGTGTNTATLRMNAGSSATNRMMTNLATIGNINYSDTGLKHMNSDGLNSQKYINNGVLVSSQTIGSAGPATIQNITVLRSQNAYGNSTIGLFGLGSNTTQYSSSLNDAVTIYLSSI
jgi:hypothetical protein